MVQAGRLLLTGFEPFGGDLRNPSIEVARALDGQTIGRLQVVAQELPCDFARAAEVMAAAIDRWSPKLVLAMGLAAGRPDLSFERVAINLIDARIADNAGAQPVDMAVCEAGPAAFFSTLPIKRMVAAVRSAGIPASVSHSAGTFVCNQVFYELQRRLHMVTPLIPSGFVHLPMLTEQTAQQLAADSAGPPSLELAQLVAGLRAALLAAQADPGSAGCAASEGSIA